MKLDLTFQVAKANFLTVPYKKILPLPDESLPHTSVMLTHFVGGATFPPFSTCE